MVIFMSHVLGAVFVCVITFLGMRSKFKARVSYSADGAKIQRIPRKTVIGGYICLMCGLVLVSIFFYLFFSDIHDRVPGMIVTSLGACAALFYAVVILCESVFKFVIDGEDCLVYSGTFGRKRVIPHCEIEFFGFADRQFFIWDRSGRKLRLNCVYLEIPNVRAGAVRYGKPRKPSIVDTQLRLW
ncbi:hypothetical protein KRX54_01330 [Actinomycetaceae bacterium TAE3-ERU4]|nr:hypothetical protein [Actinomycetaceae bacterium TAE3-ERU4]